MYVSSCAWFQRLYVSIPLVRNSSPAHKVSNSTSLGDSMRIVNSYRTSGCDSMRVVVAVVIVGVIV